jgi:hypothetical protein
MMQLIVNAEKKTPGHDYSAFREELQGAEELYPLPGGRFLIVTDQNIEAWARRLGRALGKEDGVLVTEHPGGKENR